MSSKSQAYGSQFSSQNKQIDSSPPPYYSKPTVSKPESMYGAYSNYAPPFNPALGQNYTPVIMTPTAPGADYVDHSAGHYGTNASYYDTNEGQPGLYPYTPVDQLDKSAAALKEFFRKYEISPSFQEDIDVVRKYDIIIIGDDSTSMRDPSRYLSFKTNTIVNKTRWDELKETVAVVTELACILDDDGIDVRFLNEAEPHKNIATQAQVMELFNRAPTGRTPLTRVLQEVMLMPTRKPKLILIVTDGEPNDDDGYDDSENFLRLAVHRDVNDNRIAILVCTSADKQMAWLQRVDKEAKHVDVVDDYYTERDQILEVQGADFSYSHGDHVLKMLLGPILQKYDDLDEKPLPKRNQYKQTVGRSTNHLSERSMRQSPSSKQKTNDCCIL